MKTRHAGDVGRFRSGRDYNRIAGVFVSIGPDSGDRIARTRQTHHLIACFHDSAKLHDPRKADVRNTHRIDMAV